jgi:hypothetical protein
MLCSSHLLLGFPTGRSSMSTPHSNQSPTLWRGGLTKSTTPTAASASFHIGRTSRKGENKIFSSPLSKWYAMSSLSERFRVGRLGVFLARLYTRWSRARNCPEFPSSNSKAIQTREFDPGNSKRTILSLNYDNQT